MEGLFKSRESLGGKKHGSTDTKMEMTVLRNLFLVSTVYVVTMLPFTILGTV
jgi:hypothetical protein